MQKVLRDGLAVLVLSKDSELGLDTAECLTYRLTVGVGRLFRVHLGRKRQEVASKKLGIPQERVVDLIQTHSAQKHFVEKLRASFIDDGEHSPRVAVVSGGEALVSSTFHTIFHTFLPNDSLLLVNAGLSNPSHFCRVENDAEACLKDFVTNTFSREHLTASQYRAVNGLLEDRVIYLAEEDEATLLELCGDGLRDWKERSSLVNTYASGA